MIPPRSKRKEQLHYDKAIYRQRNQVEQFFNRLKHSRRIATRNEKYAHTFLAVIHLASIFLYIR